MYGEEHHFLVSILAKLQTIPKDYYEAAEIDGAGLWKKFRYITLPEVKDVTILSRTYEYDLDH